MCQGWIKLYRQLEDWEWYTDIPVKTLFIHCLIKANFEDTEWRGMEIKRGQFVTSISSLANATGLSVKQTRNALEKLENTGETANKTSNKYTLITVTCYEDFQEEGKQRANKGQTKGKQRATVKERKKERIKEDSKKEKLKKEKIDLINSSFEKVWKDYPNVRPKGNKEPARKNYFKILENEKDYESYIKTLEESAGRYSSFIRQTQSFNLHCSTFFNPKDKRWVDEYKTTETATKPSTAPNWEAEAENIIYQRRGRDIHTHPCKSLQISEEL